MSKTKPFNLRTVISMTTGYLVTEDEGPQDDGFDDLRRLGGWMMGDDGVDVDDVLLVKATCAAAILALYPELSAFDDHVGALGSLIEGTDTLEAREDAIARWVASVPGRFRDAYDIPQLEITRL